MPASRALTARTQPSACRSTGPRAGAHERPGKRRDDGKGVERDKAPRQAPTAGADHCLPGVTSPPIGVFFYAKAKSPLANANSGAHTLDCTLPARQEADRTAGTARPRNPTTDGS